MIGYSIVSAQTGKVLESRTLQQIQSMGQFFKKQTQSQHMNHVGPFSQTVELLM